MNSLDFENMATRVIDNPYQILVGNFSIYDLVEKDRKSYKSELVNVQHINSTNISAIPYKKDKFIEKSSHFLINTVESPKEDRLQRTQNGDIFCQ